MNNTRQKNSDKEALNFFKFSFISFSKIFPCANIEILYANIKCILKDVNSIIAKNIML